MLGFFILLAGISSCLCQDSSSGIQESAQSHSVSPKLFAECPEVYASYCIHGSCRLFISAAAAACVCLTGYNGDRCQYVDLLQVMAKDPHALSLTRTSVIAVLIVLACLAGMSFGIFFCIRRNNHPTPALLDNCDDITDV
ncbi:protransforming growth factor alpha [Microcaecilia unicolor]|uniref:Protransforming growth factor alpha-like n=1 Tax=Microcaecilia unicolor TaxID=1415580 RepID=A0A6P7YD44_9AMPH|nr:protransforming growth factor alpha-like [Microcaecilia unicolor]